MIHLFDDLELLYVEMSLNHGLKALRWILQLPEHGEFDIGKPDDITVALVLLLAFSASSLILETGFVEVDVLRHNNSLNRHKDLENRREFGIPILGCTTPPCAEETEADLAARI